VDVLVVALLLAAAWWGRRQALRRVLAPLLSVLFILLLGRILYTPLGYALGAWLGQLPRVSDALALSLSAVVIGVGLFIFADRVAAAVADRALAWFPTSLAADRVLGAVASTVQAYATVAVILLLAADLAAVSWASSLIDASLLGRASIDLWRDIYPGL
jgi:hypothetical protein